MNDEAFFTEGEWYPFSSPAPVSTVEAFTLPDRIVSIGVDVAVGSDCSALVCMTSDGQIYRVTKVIGGRTLPNKHRRQKRLRRVAAQMAMLAVMFSGCVTAAPPRAPLPAMQVDPYAPPATLVAPVGQSSLACNGVDAVCWRRGDVTRCWCGERR